MFISQTAISKQINVLESILGFRIFDRRPYRPALTAAGKCFYFSSKKLVDDYYKAVQKAKLLKGGYKETIRIGICGAAENKLLPPILKAFMEDCPEINIDISEGNFFSLSKSFVPKYHEQFIKACQQDGFQPRIAKEVNSLDEMILMVYMNKGIAII